MTMEPKLIKPGGGRNLRTCLMNLGLVTGFAVTPSLAATWTGGTSTDWNDTTNWDAAPGGDSVFVNTSAGNTPLVSGNPSFTPVDIFVGQGGGTGLLDHSDGLLSTGAGNWFFVGVDAGSVGTYNMSGLSSLSGGRLIVGQAGGTGTMTVNTSGTVEITSPGVNFWDNSAIAIGVDGPDSGTFNLEAGTVTSHGDIWVGAFNGGGTLDVTGGTFQTNTTATSEELLLGYRGGVGEVNVTNGALNAGSIILTAADGASTTSTGTMTVNNGGSVFSEGDMVIGFAGNGQGTLNINAGGTVDVGSADKRWLIVNQYDSAQGTILVDGGTLNLNADTDITFNASGSTGASVVTLAAGAINGGAGSLIRLNEYGSASSNNTFNLNGGLLSISGVTTNVDDGIANFNFNGGTLIATADNAAFIELGGASQSASVLAGGANIDSNGFDVTVVDGLVDGGGGGGLTKLGAGTLTLAGASTYTGATIVSAGTLLVNGSLGASAVTVESGATIGGSGMIAGSLSFAAGSMLDTTAGTLDMGGALVTFTNFGFGDLAGFDVYTAAEGTYTFLTGSNIVFDNIANFGEGNALALDGGRSAYFQNGSLQVVIVPEPQAALLGGLGLLGLMRRRRSY